MGFSRQEYWSGLQFPSLGDLPNPGIEPRSPTMQADSLPTELWGKPILFLPTMYLKMENINICLQDGHPGPAYSHVQWTVLYPLQERPESHIQHCAPCKASTLLSFPVSHPWVSLLLWLLCWEGLYLQSCLLPHFYMRFLGRASTYMVFSIFDAKRPPGAIFLALISLCILNSRTK